MNLVSRTIRYAVLTVGALALAAPSVQAAEIFTASLSGANEVPARATPGTGSALLTYDGVTGLLTLSTVFFGLTTPTVAAHIHCCGPATANAGVAIDVPSLPGFPLGVRAGSFTGSFDLLDATNYSPAFLTNNGGTAMSARAALLAGLRTRQGYLNIHSERFPGGEIRGQFMNVPEPSTWAMAILGFGAVGAAARRRRRSASTAFA